MSSLNAREQQLAGLRDDAAKKLNRERELLAAAVKGEVMPAGAKYLFGRPGQFPGWHPAVSNLLLDAFQFRAYGLPVSIIRFFVEGGALSSEFTEEAPAVVERLLNDSLRASTGKVCCNCGGLRDSQPMSIERMACAVCVFADLMFETDMEAKAAGSWVPLTDH